jgi:hypothetical protein
MNNRSAENEGFRILEEFACQAISDASALASLSLRVEIHWPGVRLQSIADELRVALPAEYRGQVALSVEPSPCRPGALPMDSAMIAGIIQGVTLALDPFLTALLTRAREHNSKSVVIVLPDETKHELPTDASPEEIRQIAVAVEGAGNARITIIE